VSRGSPTEEFGPYTVYEQLGVGGMAQVHRAVEMGADVPRPVALKRMLSHIASSEDMVRSFVREARLASYLRHDNVAQTYDLGRVGDVYFIVMELITGRNLREVLRHCGRTTGPMPVPVALNILNQICDALDYAHNLRDETGQPLGIIHRDVSPSNVIVSDAGVVKLIDFGIAKASGGGMQTMGGTLKGKFGYMAPEYIAGRIDARADLFAVGVIAHELLTNRPLFSGRDDIDTLTRVRDMHIDPPSKKNPQVPLEIDDIVMTALARDPDRRWQHATALRTALTTLTRRLGLVASNAQMVQWLDWAFTHQAPRERDRLETDTDTDGEPLADDHDSSDDPSISIEQRTVQLLAMSQKSTLVMEGGPDGAAYGGPQPPLKTPLGTPAYVPAQRSSPPASIVDPGSGRAGLVPRAAASAVVPPMARSSSVIPVRAGSPSSPPPIAAALSRPSSPSSPPPIAAQIPSRPSSPSSPPPIAAQIPSRPSSPSSPPPIAAYAGLAQLPASARPAATILSTSVPAPTYPAPAAISRGYAVPTPARPALHAGPVSAPRPARPSSPPPLSYDPERSAKVQRDFAQRVSAPPAPAPAAPAGGSALLAVVLVVLAAAIAAITVYFVLPLLT
jgi:eukaryotic-like serine/threonine-protein kinase